jgi:hypothetical protein
MDEAAQLCLLLARTMIALFSCCGSKSRYTIYNTIKKESHNHDIILQISARSMR